MSDRFFLDTNILIYAILESPDSLSKKLIARNILSSHFKRAVIGSRIKEHHHPGADFDIAVDHPQPPFRLARKILDSLNAYAGLHKIDIVYLPDVDEDFRTMILETGRVIYENPA